jgi:hypothetical protein
MKVTDDGLEPLAGHTHLQKLMLGSDHITASGTTQLATMGSGTLPASRSSRSLAFAIQRSVMRVSPTWPG